MAARNGPGTIPSEKRGAAKELIRRGTSYSEVQRITGVSAGTCSNIRRELEREGAVALSAQSPARRDLPPPPTPRAPAAPAPPSSLDALPPPSEPPALADDGGAIGEDFAVLQQQERDVEALLVAARGRNDYVAMERLTRMRIDLRRGMAQLRPPPPVDPEADVANTEAARLLVARVRKMVRARQERART